MGQAAQTAMPFDEGQRGLGAQVMPSGQTEVQLRLAVRTAGSEDSKPTYRTCSVK